MLSTLVSDSLTYHNILQQTIVEYNMLYCNITYNLICYKRFVCCITMHYNILYRNMI